ncbi:hypothetical protein FKB34_01225 [Glycocaulis profundi]|nr:hypothetical protein FKB34_01225 [Glycocaulis profundi]
MTETTLILARILGGYMLIMGVAMLVHRTMAAELMERLKDDFSLTFTLGLIALLFGLIIVSVHPFWNTPLAVVVSIVGWLGVIEGALIALLRTRFMAIIAPLVTGGTFGLIWGALAALLGLALLLGGFGVW